MHDHTTCKLCSAMQRIRYETNMQKDGDIGAVECFMCLSSTTLGKLIEGHQKQHNPIELGISVRMNEIVYSLEKNENDPQFFKIGRRAEELLDTYEVGIQDHYIYLIFWGMSWNPSDIRKEFFKRNIYVGQGQGGRDKTHSLKTEQNHHLVRTLELAYNISHAMGIDIIEYSANFDIRPILVRVKENLTQDQANIIEAAMIQAYGIQNLCNDDEEKGCRRYLVPPMNIKSRDKKASFKKVKPRTSTFKSPKNPKKPKDLKLKLEFEGYCYKQYHIRKKEKSIVYKCVVDKCRAIVVVKNKEIQGQTLGGHLHNANKTEVSQKKLGEIDKQLEEFGSYWLYNAFQYMKTLDFEDKDIVQHLDLEPRITIESEDSEDEFLNVPTVEDDWDEGREEDTGSKSSTDDKNKLLESVLSDVKKLLKQLSENSIISTETAEQAQKLRAQLQQLEPTSNDKLHKLEVKDVSKIVEEIVEKTEEMEIDINLDSEYDSKSEEEEEEEPKPSTSNFK